MDEPRVMPPIDLTVAGKDHVPPLATALFDELNGAGVELSPQAEGLIANALIRAFGFGARAGIGELSATLEEAGLASVFNEFHISDPGDVTELD